MKNKKLKTFSYFLFPIFCFLIFKIGNAQPPNVLVTRWVSPNNAQPLTFREWRRRQKIETAWSVKPVFRPKLGKFLRVDILVEDSLFPFLTSEIDTFVNDLRQDGYEAAVYTVRGSSPESLRNFLIAEYQTGMVASVFVGDLPIAWFQMIDDWNNNRRRDPDEGYEEFPCELYFMDLDGIWEDNFVQYDTLDSLVLGQDSIFDTHYGHLAPEIAISRLPVSVLGDEVSLLRSYFNRNHRYRKAQLPLRDRALVYIDDDWVPWAEQWNEDVGILYPERVFIWDPEETRALDYRPRLDTTIHQWVALFAHSWPGGHGFKYNNGQEWDWFWAYEIPVLNPAATFYNLFACSNARFVESGFAGGSYVFKTTTGLAAIGSTKTGSMLEFQDFYLPLAEGWTIGAALAEWFRLRIDNGLEPWERSWFYGMCLLGDGLLKVHSPLDVGVKRIVAPRGRIDSGSVVTPQAVVKNFGNLRTDFRVVMRIGSDYEEIREIRDLNAGDSLLINFRSWTARQPGTHIVRCSTLLADDADSLNNFALDSVIIFSSGIGEEYSQLPTPIPSLGNLTNPFLTSLTINFILDREVSVNLFIYNSLGQTIRSLKMGKLKPGKNQIIWDGRDEKGQLVKRGIYFYHLQSEKWAITKKIVKL